MSWSANETECQICHGGFNDPRILTCLHAFCRKCFISSMTRKEIKCPTCRLEFDVSLISTSDVSPGLFLQLFAETEDSVARRTLGLCRDCNRKPAITSCTKCSMHFCRSCSKKHVNEGHKVDIDETLRSKLADRSEQRCHTHTERAVSFCVVCRLNLCSPCSGSHVHDRVVKIAECIDMLMGAVANSTSSRITDVFKEIQRMAETKSKFFERISDELEKIKSRSDRLRELVDKRELALQVEVKETDLKSDECSMIILNLEKEINEVTQQLSNQRYGVPTFIPYHRIMHVYSRVFELQLKGDNRRDLSSVKTPSSPSIIQCVVCKRRVSDPRLLSCFHTACSQCLKDTRTKACPTCQMKIWDDKCKNVSDLPSILFIQVLADVQAAASDIAKDMATCKQCNKKAMSIYCKTHGQGLCDNCYTAHSASGQHETEAVDDERMKRLIEGRFNKCNSSKRQDSCNPPYDYCFNCKANVCYSCGSESHRSHTRKSLKMLLDDFLRFAFPAVDHFKLLLREVKRDSEHGEEKKKRFEKPVEIERMAIALRCGSIADQIDITETEMQEQLHNENKKALQSVQSRRQQLHAKFSRMKQHIEKVKEMELMANKDNLPYTRVMDVYWQSVELLHSDSSPCTDLDLLKTFDVELESVARKHQQLLDDLKSQLNSADIMSDKSSDGVVGERRRHEVHRSQLSVSISTHSRNEASSTNNLGLRKFCRRPVGLLNMGNSCYFNAVMQSMSQTPLFWDLLLERTRKMEMPAKCVYIALKILTTSLPQNILPDLCLRIAIGGYTSEGPFGVRFEIPLSILNESKGVFALQLYRETTKELLGSELMNIQRNLLTAAEQSDTPTMRNIVFQNNRSHSMRFEMSVSFSPSTVIQSLINFFNETAVLDGSGTHKPSELLNSICARSDKYRGQLQQDSHELLRRLMDAVKDEENRFNADGKSTRSPQAENYPRESVQLTIVEQVFGGHFLTVFHCHKCQMPYHLFEPFLDISLQIVPPDTESEARSRHTQRNSGRQNDRNVGLFTASTMMESTARSAGGRQPTEYETAIRAMKEPMAVVSIDCLQQAFSALTKSYSVVQSLIHYTREEQLQEHLCLNCNKNNDGTNYELTPGTKQTIIYNPPAVLTIHIKRFMQNANGNYRKYEDLVLFEETLDFAPFCSQHSKRQQRDKKIVYRLYGVIVHIGNLQSGHYTACVKMREAGDGKRAMKFLQAEFLDRQSLMDKKKFIELLGNPSKYLKDEPDPEVDSNGQWFEISDTRVDRIDFDRVRRQQAYMLFYERVH